MSILDALAEIPEEQAIKYVKTYYGRLTPDDEGYDVPFHGSYFDDLDRNLLNDDENLITGSDLYALTMLEVEIERKAGVDLLIYKAEEITQLLSCIPNTPLAELSRAEFETHVSNSSPAAELWRTFYSIPSIGSTRASKLLARKRPHLIPIHDRFIKEVTGVSARNDWEQWWVALTDETQELQQRAEVLRASINRPDLSTLRVLDVMFWYSRKYGIHSNLPSR
ncbi:DUF6308 family protein [Enteractinococcus coprophilus]|uniref:Uncharacterized protein n=1 Tax=Enteractinococcus coprophilus TaxID=1027633 RepID=A0A543AGB8_9MICC|nr:DUF6308 family protein [Enteractinococcus coprophilus]TQL71631.1 hypothetical protein FB556_2119 [Enteractinococcus coprophilus]